MSDIKLPFKIANLSPKKQGQELQSQNGISRRGLMKGVLASSAFVLAARWDFAFAEDEKKKYGADAMPNGWTDNPNVFISIHPDNTVTITNHRSEMGQGIRTSLVMVAADELGADWNKVQVNQAKGDEKIYGNQNTDGSRSMRHWFTPMRRAAAAARTMLEQAAAQQWKVPVKEVEVGVHEVVHKPSGKTISFGKLAAIAAELPVPNTEKLILKLPKQWRYIGKQKGPSHSISAKNMQRPLAIDGEDIVTGKAVFGADVELEGMLYAVVARPPVYGGKVANFDSKKALQVPGVVKVLEIKCTPQPAAFNPLGGVAVIATNTWAAMEGRKKLDVKWNNSEAKGNEKYTTDTYKKTLEKRSESPGKVVRKTGDIKSAFEKASKKVEANYYMPHLVHAPMEPPVAIVQIKKGKAEVWAPVQNPQATRDNVAGRLGLKPENVAVNVTLLGGGFGRKSKPDFVLEAASLSQAMDGKPVRVQWTREDDIHHSYFHALSVDHMEAALDKKGKVLGWRHRTVSPTIQSLFAPDPEHKGGFELGMGFNTMPFQPPALQLENPEAEAHMRIGWFRSVYNLPHAFAIQSFAAELAAAAGKDHRDYLLDLLGKPRKIDPRELGDTWNYNENPALYPIDIARMRAVIKKATDEAGWSKKRKKNRGLGLAMHYSFVSYTAVVLDVEVEKDGKVIIHNADVAFDCGPQINPERIRSQMEGSCVMGIGIALLNEITTKDGIVQQDNFHNYLVPRMEHAPHNVRVHLVGGDDPNAPLGGVGEPGLPPVAPALCNAIFAATGKRIRELPIGKQLAS